MPPANPKDPIIGSVIDNRYEILQRIGEGGMGVVYQARQTSIDRPIAIKMLNQSLASDPNWVNRFYNEAKACSRLQHPNTIRMFDFGQTQEGLLFMTMELLDGRSLRREIAQFAPMATNRVANILIQCCASLSEAHSFGIIHRDIKPDNVFLLSVAGNDDYVKLLDFSVAKLLQQSAGAIKTQAGVVFGTPQYMSPEQGRGIPLDPRSDIYGLGILAYEMLTGGVPFNDPNPLTVLQQHMSGKVPPLPATIPAPISRVVMQALEREPNRRFQSADEMMKNLLHLVETGMSGFGYSAGSMAGGPQKTAILDARSGEAPSPLPGGSSSEAKTMMADLGAALGGPPPVADAAQKTMMAAALPSTAAGAPPSLPDSGHSGPRARQWSQPPSHRPPHPVHGGPNKTMLLDAQGASPEASHGALHSGGAAVNHGNMHNMSWTGSSAGSMARHRDDPPSLLYWVLCLGGGLAIGVLAWLIVRVLS